MNKNYKDIDTWIKESFQLFEGKRSKEEDQKIYDKVYDLVFEEIISFLEDNLASKEQEKLAKEIESLNKEISHSALEVLLKYANKIESYQFKLDRRLKYFIDQLVVSSLNNLSKK